MAKPSAKARLKQAPFHKDPNIWVLLAVILVQIISVTIVFSLNPAYAFFGGGLVILPFLGYVQILTLPGVFALMVLAIFVFATMANTMGERGKQFIRWTVVLLALGSAALAVAHAWQITAAEQSSGGFWSHYEF